MFRWLKRSSKSRVQAAEPPVPHQPDDWDFLRAQPDFDADDLAEVRPRLPEEADPVRSERSPLPGPRVEPGTRPLLLLGDLGLPLRDGAPDSRPPSAEPAWTVTLEVTVRGRTARYTLAGDTIIGRRDPETGRAPDLDLSADDAVSRRHARVYSRAGRYWIQDLDSLNGTRHNQAWLAPGGEAPLAPGDEIALGACCRLRVVDPLLEAGDPGLTDLLQVALGGMLFAEMEYEAQAAPRCDVLDLALERGGAVGLLEDVRPAAE